MSHEAGCQFSRLSFGIVPVTRTNMSVLASISKELVCPTSMPRLKGKQPDPGKPKAAISQSCPKRRPTAGCCAIDGECPAEPAPKRGRRAAYLEALSQETEEDSSLVIIAKRMVKQLSQNDLRDLNGNVKLLGDGVLVGSLFSGSELQQRPSRPHTHWICQERVLS